MIEKCKWSTCCALIIAGHFILAPLLAGADANSDNTAPAQQKPSGVLSNAAAAAAAAADAATAAANAANAAAKAATAALEALNSIIPPSQQRGQTKLTTTKTTPVSPAVPPATTEKKQPQESIVAEQQKAVELPLVTGQTKFTMPEEHSLVGLVGKFEVPVSVDTGGEFVKLLASNPLLANEPATPLSETNLFESVRAGRSYSRETLAAGARTDQAKAQTGQALALMLPSVSVRASVGSETSTPSVALGSDGKPISSETHNRKDVAFTVRQPLFDLSSYYDWRRRKVVENAKAEGQRSSDADAYLATANSYLSLVSTRLQADLTHDFEAQLLELQTYIEKRTRAGAASVSDTARVRARSQAAISSRLEFESAHAAAGIEFVRLTNVVPRMVRLPETDDIGANAIPDSLDKAVTLAMVSNPEISSLTAEMQAARIDKHTAKSRFLPRLDFEYTDNYSLHAGGDQTERGQRDQRAMFVLNWNLFSGGGDYRYHNERSARYTELKYRLDDQRRRIVQGLSANYATLATTRERINSGYRELKSISIAADAMSKRMLSGNQSLLDLLDVYDRHYQVRVRLVNLHILEMNTVAQVVRLVSGTPKASTDLAPLAISKSKATDEPKSLIAPPATPKPDAAAPATALPEKSSAPSTPKAVPADATIPPEPLAAFTAPLVPTTVQENSSASPPLSSERDATSAASDKAKLMRLKTKAETGNAAAQRKMGWLYSSGTWVAADKSEAILWYKKAASQGDTEALLALGWMYYTGNGVKSNPAEAASYYRQAAAKGNSKAVAMLKKIEVDTQPTELAHETTALLLDKPENRRPPYLFKH